MAAEAELPVGVLRFDLGRRARRCGIHGEPTEGRACSGCVELRLLVGAMSDAHLARTIEAHADPTVRRMAREEAAEREADR